MDSFLSTISHFVDDLLITFPEHTNILGKWSSIEIQNRSENESTELFDHCSTTYPPFFFDILNKNHEIFHTVVNNDMRDVEFLPGMNFKLLFDCPDITESTKESIWNYLQIVLFSVIGSVKDKNAFGSDAAGLFANMDDGSMLSKLSECIQAAFSKQSEGEDTNPSPEQESKPEMPNPEDMHKHLKGLFDGKIGSLAKELAEEIANDLQGFLGDDFKDVKSTQDILKKIMKNPSKITNLFKIISDKLQSRMKSGDISEEELMKESQELMSKFKGFEGLAKDGRLAGLMKLFSKFISKGSDGAEGDDANGSSDIDFEAMMKKMTGGMDLEKMMAGFDPERMAKPHTEYAGQGIRTGSSVISGSMRDKMKQRIVNKNIQKAHAIVEAQKRMAEAEKNYVPYEFSDDEDKSSIKKTNKESKVQVFSVEGEGKQEISTSNDLSGNGGDKKKKNKNKNKNKK